MITINVAAFMGVLAQACVFLMLILGAVVAGFYVGWKVVGCVSKY
jgi:hypothetical protein